MNFRYLRIYLLYHLSFLRASVPPWFIFVRSPHPQPLLKPAQRVVVGFGVGVRHAEFDALLDEAVWADVST